MKVRTDYVSNSSSSSFVINKDADKAAKMFLDDFGQYLTNCYGDSLGETFHVGVIERGSENEWHEWMLPEDFAQTYIQGKYDCETHTHATPKKPEDIVSLSFDCDDWDHTGMMYLVFLYKYFKKFGFEPDTSCSEQTFPPEENDSFLGKILDRLSPNTPGEAPHEDSH
jgi:hypothetical protein